MTLNQVVRRIKQLALAHKQIRDFREGLVTDWFADQTAKYPAVLLQDNGGSISTDGHATTLNYRVFFADLVHVSEDAKDNRLDVQSDMLSIAMDLVAQMNSGIFDEWYFSKENPLSFFDEGENDLYAGCYVDFSIRIVFAQDTCQIPTELIPGSPTDTDMKVYDVTYNAPADVSTLTIPEIKGKKILMIIRESSVIFPVSNLPGSTEYTFDGTDIGLGVQVNGTGERFLILYRNN
jgi:hypothetical protein